MKTYKHFLEDIEARRQAHIAQTKERLQATADASRERTKQNLENAKERIQAQKDAAERDNEREQLKREIKRELGY